MQATRRKIPRVIYCRNPGCSKPRNPSTNRLCEGCGLELRKTPIFRDRYRMVRILGAGAFGRTYLALDLDCLDRPCVIKKFTAQVKGTALQKAKELFAQEAKRLYELEHSQIPRLYGYFGYENSLYLVQEYIEGIDLQKELQKRGAFSEAQVLLSLKDILPVLGYIHSRRILHRDLKPTNIMRRKKDGRLVLIDFGGAKQISESSQITQGTQLFTPGYAAIEHIMGKPNRASDLYSMGATFVRLLTGCFPTRDENSNIIDNIYDSGNAHWLWREYLEEQGVNISPRLGEIFDKLLQPFAQNRYQTAEEVLAALNTSHPPVLPQLSSVAPSVVPSITPPPPSPSTVKPVTTQSQTPQPVCQEATFEFECVTVVPQRLGRVGKKQQITFDTRSEKKTAKSLIIELEENLSLEMVSIPSGKFIMGSSPREEGRSDYESPEHEVTVSSFYMGKYPITQAQWRLLMQSNPSSFKTENHPVERVNWEDAVEFCRRLSENVGREFRLPSEAEWEYACRANTTTPFHYGVTLNTDVANYYGKSTYGLGITGMYRGSTTEVGSFSPNAFGLYDMHGNVWEWCGDSWHDDYTDAPIHGEVWEEGGDENKRILRGGAWNIDPSFCRSAHRYGYAPDYKDNVIGFRVVCG